MRTYKKTMIYFQKSVFISQGYVVASRARQDVFINKILGARLPYPLIYILYAHTQAIILLLYIYIYIK